MQPSVSGATPPMVTGVRTGDDMLGTMYLGKYELDSVLGSGGMGVIYKGRQIFLDRIVAIKMLKSDMAGDKVRLRFHQEAKAASQLNHPGIVAINDFGVDEDDRPYMVMEYVEGCTLSELLRERKVLTPKDSLPVFLEICDALSAAHHKGIVHRDLKPSNIMLVAAPDGKVHIKLLDFGIARILDIQEQTLQSLTKPGEALGTPLYMSPEQITGQKITHHSDLYSLGCLMYASLIGTPPFIADSKLATLEKHCTEKPTPFKIAAAGQDFPPGIESIVMRLLEKRPFDRFNSVDQLKDALIEMAAQNGYMKRPENSEGSAGQLYLTGAIPEMPKSISDMVPKVQTEGSFGALFDATRDDRASTPAAGVPSGTSTPSTSSAGSGSASFTGTPVAPTGSSSSFGTSSYSSGRVPDFSTSTSLPAVPSSPPADQDVVPVKGVFRKGTQYEEGGMTRRLPGRDRELAGLTAQGQTQAEAYVEEMPPVAVESSITKTFAIFGAIAAVAVVVLVWTVVAMWHPQTTQSTQNNQSAHQATHSQSTTSGATTASSAAGISPADQVIEQRLGGGAQDSFLSIRDQAGLSDRGLKALSQFKLLTSFDAAEADLKDAVVIKLATLPLSTLNLDANMGLSDWSLRELAHMPDLRVLSLNHTGITDGGLVYLAKSKSLRKLYANGNTQISDKGVANLAPQTSKLETLSLAGCKITDAAAASFNRFKRMAVLDISQNGKVTGKTIQALKSIKSLHTLALAQDDIGDEGIEALASFKNLKTLDLSFLKISEKGLADLAALKNLNCIYLQECSLTTPQIQKLREALPGVRIETSMRFQTDPQAANR